MILGTYSYSFAVSVYPLIQVQRFSLRVEVLQKSGTRLKVRFMQFHADKRGPGTITWVQARNVQIDNPQMNLPL